MRKIYMLALAFLAIAGNSWDAKAQTQSSKATPSARAKQTLLVDTEPPTKPTNLIASFVYTRQFRLDWDDATDNVGVDHYTILRDNVIILDNFSYNVAEIGGLTPGVTYSITIVAKDAAGNVSDTSEALIVTTNGYPSNPGADILGTNTVGSVDDVIGPHFLNADAIYIPVGGSALTATSIHVNIANSVAGGHIKCAIAIDNNYQNGPGPQAILRSTNERIDPGTGWQQFDLTSPVVLEPDQAYWIVVWTDAEFSVKAETTGGNAWYQGRNYDYEDWPRNLENGAGPNTTYRHSIYVTGTIGNNNNQAAAKPEPATFAPVANADASFRIYPNPLQGGNFNIDLGSQRSIANIHISDVSGRVVYRKNIQHPGRIVSVNAALTPGVYVVKIDDGQRTYTKKIVTR